jgi:hypothetical protein
MARRRKPDPARRPRMIVTEPEVVRLRAVVEAILRLAGDQDNHDADDERIEMLNQIYEVVPAEDFERFAQIIADANNPDYRSTA